MYLDMIAHIQSTHEVVCLSLRHDFSHLIDAFENVNLLCLPLLKTNRAQKLSMTTALLRKSPHSAESHDSHAITFESCEISKRQNLTISA